MAFQKSFPRTTDKTVYPKWEEITLDDKEELKIEEEARHSNNKLMAQCLEDAEKVLKSKGFEIGEDFENHMVKIAISLFEKRASHQVYWKEKAAKEKFDQSSP